MKWKLVSAFATGALLASGIVYFAVRPTPSGEEKAAEPKIEQPKNEVPQRVASVEKTAPQPVPAAPVPEVAAKPPAPPAHSHVPVLEKRSPFRPLIRHDEPLPIAKYETPPTPPAVLPPPQRVPAQNVSLPAPKKERDAPSVTLAAGSVLPIRIGQSISSARNQPGDTFVATLAQPLVVDGWVIAERGARVEGRVMDKGVGYLRISIVRLATSDGQNVRIQTEPYVKYFPEVPAETRMNFKVQDSVTITERMD